MTETASTRRTIAVWVLRVTLGLAFLAIGAVKLTGSLHTVQLFANIGWGQWFRYFTGLLDIGGALLLFVGRWTFYGALLLACTVGLAALLTFAGRIHDRAVAPMALTLLAFTLAWLTRPRQAELAGRSIIS